MKTRVDNLDSIGLVTDRPSYDLPPNAWSAMQNIRLHDGKVSNFAGHSVYSAPTVTPYYLLPVAEGANYYWIYAGLDKIYCFDGSTHTNITRQTTAVDVDYTGGVSDRWNGGVLNGLPVLNNGVDHPQMWSPVAPATKMQILTAWDTNWTCKAMRTFKYFLIALNMTESGSEYPHKIRWSNSADPGAVPTAWTPASTNDAGSNVLGDTDGYILDGLALGDMFVIYKEDSVHGMQYIGGNNVFRFWPMKTMPGILAQDCAKAFTGGHFVVAKRDVYVHDGQGWSSVIDERNRDYLFDSIDSDNYTSTYVAHNRKKTEMWICYPDTGQSLPNKALVWNYSKNTWYQRDLPTDTAFIQEGILTTTAYTWDTLPYAEWGDWNDAWGTRGYSPTAVSLVGASDTLYKFDDGNQFNGVNPTCYAERTGLNLGDNQDAHTVTAIYPQIEGGDVAIYIGSQSAPNAAVTWAGPYSFTPGADTKIDCRVTGRYHGIKFQTAGNITWGISGYEVKYSIASRR